MEGYIDLYAVPPTFALQTQTQPRQLKETHAVSAQQAQRAHRRFPPEQQQLLCGTHLPLIDRHPSRTQILLRVPYTVLFRIHLARRIRIRVAPLVVVLEFSVCRRRRFRVVDTGLEEDEGDGGDDGPSGFEGPVTPIVVPSKSTACRPSHGSE